VGIALATGHLPGLSGGPPASDRPSGKPV